jgi:hypothetical protein
MNFYFLFFVVLSYSTHNARLYNLVRQPLNKKVEAFLPAVGNDKDSSKSVGIQQLNSVEEEDNMQLRNNWDSGEDYYFQWANQHRRPVENLAGRKREVNPAIIAARARRINGGLWRSGLVG